MPLRSHHPLCLGSVLYCTLLFCDYSPFSLSYYIPCLESRSMLGCYPFSFPYHYFYLPFDVRCPTELSALIFRNTYDEEDAVLVFTGLERGSYHAARAK
ncbi:hypothetical protein BGW80DRAFT_1348149 [Lactifluus volemus]|nr:hypothetical protein BGW80DRAFT_1348149 [Lactifluus volemus]